MRENKDNTREPAERSEYLLEEVLPEVSNENRPWQRAIPWWIKFSSANGWDKQQIDIFAKTKRSENLTRTHFLNTTDNTDMKYYRKYYKDCPPEITIERIKQILRNIGIEIEVLCRINEFGYYSARVRVTNNPFNKFNIGTNGKGRNQEFAIASALAEFMERLQNHILFRGNLLQSSKYAK